MSKASMEIQTCVLKVNIHCDGCKQDVTKALRKINGVLTVEVEKEQSKVTVLGTADPDLLIRKLREIGKHPELLNAQKSHNGDPDPWIRDIHIDGADDGNNYKDQKEGGGGSSGGSLCLMAP
ncbi:heavy metal-associated isoprenylated plant protein 32 [Eucalyptus grandis]|uniref:Uncharacterized protein n=2 Tax=Eucalyptus grandis TaxID=71139 RepID=A0ACC3JU73_EUCGR|nr:heavy metal-associated isoprenylated plant protein 32 [Eucalyptus grandis]KAK3417648.1 hypothetical protein EUGRSUZ_H03595 [Eucalyptus grandis]